eukprot:6334997-Prymnesium_polylepis.1
MSTSQAIRVGRLRQTHASRFLFLSLTVNTSIKRVASIARGVGAYPALTRRNYPLEGRHRTQGSAWGVRGGGCEREKRWVPPGSEATPRGEHVQSMGHARCRRGIEVLRYVQKTSRVPHA